MEMDNEKQIPDTAVETVETPSDTVNENSETVETAGITEENADFASEDKTDGVETAEDTQTPKKKKKVKVVYLEDKGQTIYSMAMLTGKTPEELEEFEKRKRETPMFTGGEKWAMMKAAFTVYGPLLLIAIGSFGLTGLLLYLFLI